jgi:glyoxylase-like metal-dependent hydrolase (beta-lactamase superfamily II)
MSETIATRHLGDARVSVVATARCFYTPSFPAGTDWRTPDTPLTGDGMAQIGVNSLVIQTPDRTTVVDPASFRPDETTLGGGSVLEPGPSLDTSLRELEVDPADVELVVITHGHDDHFIGVLDEHGQVRFPNAQHVFPQADWDDICNGDMHNADGARAFLQPVQDAGLLRLVSGDVDLGGGVSVLFTPGESNGHQIMRFDAGDERVYYMGDLFHFPIEFIELRWAVSPRPESVGDALDAARRNVLQDAAAKPSSIVFTHGIFPAWGTVAPSADDAWTWRYDEPPAGTR